MQINLVVTTCDHVSLSRSLQVSFLFWGSSSSLVYLSQLRFNMSVSDVKWAWMLISTEWPRYSSHVWPKITVITLSVICCFWFQLLWQFIYCPCRCQFHCFCGHWKKQNNAILIVKAISRALGIYYNSFSCSKIKKLTDFIIGGDDNICGM